jgi:uroporphyrinogen-III decarboxylase
MMTLRERVMSVYRKEAPDQTPVGIYRRYLPRGSAEREVRSLGLAIIDYCPVVSMLAPPWHMQSGYLSEVKGADLEIRFSWDGGQKVETRSYRTPVGTVFQQTRRDPSYGSDWITKYYIEKPEDYRVMRYLVDNTVFRRDDQAFETAAADLGEDGIVLGRVDRSPFQKLLIELAGPERLVLDLSTEPEPVIELLKALDRRMDEVFCMVLDSRAEVIWQPDNITSAMTPPTWFKQYCVPYYEKHGTECRQAGKPYLVHMDGRVKALRDLIVRCPIDAIESLSMPEIGGDLSFGEARAAWPDKLVLPNFPACRCCHAKREIEEFLDGLLNEAGSGLPFMLQFSEDIPPSEWKRVIPIVCAYMQSRS